MIAGVVALLMAATILGTLLLGERRRGMDAPTWQVPGWISLGCGLAGLLAVAGPMIGSWTAPDGVDQFGRVLPWLPQASIVLGLVGLVVGGYALARRHRTWPARAGLVTGGLVTAFWLLFALGEAAASF